MSSSSCGTRGVAERQRKVWRRQDEGEVGERVASSWKSADRVSAEESAGVCALI